MTEAKSVSLNATAAFKAYSNIKANIDAAEKEAKAAKQRSSEAMDLVSGHLTTRRQIFLCMYSMLHSGTVYVL